MARPKFDNDAAIAVGEEAFGAGYKSAADRARAFHPQMIESDAAHMQAAWNDYEPSEAVKARVGADEPIDRRAAIADLLTCMFNGWKLREASWNAAEERYMRDAEDCMAEACGDEQVGYVLHLFDHWSNDLQSMSPYFGIECRRDENGVIFVANDIPPPPSSQHWWNEGAWEVMPDDAHETAPAK